MEWPTATASERLTVTVWLLVLWMKRIRLAPANWCPYLLPQAQLETAAQLRLLLQSATVRATRDTNARIGATGLPRAVEGYHLE